MPSPSGAARPRQQLPCTVPATAPRWRLRGGRWRRLAAVGGAGLSAGLCAGPRRCLRTDSSGAAAAAGAGAGQGGSGTRGSGAESVTGGGPGGGRERGRGGGRRGSGARRPCHGRQQVGLREATTPACAAGGGGVPAPAREGAVGRCGGARKRGWAPHRLPGRGGRWKPAPWDYAPAIHHSGVCGGRGRRGERPALLPSGGRPPAGRRPGRRR